MVMSVLSKLFGRGLRAGHRVEIWGGYDMEPKWLEGQKVRSGECLGFVPGENGKEAAVIRMDEPVTFENVQGCYLALRLRYVGAAWGRSETVHLELFAEEPTSLASEAARGTWIESHATYRVAGPNNSSKPTPLRGAA